MTVYSGLNDTQLIALLRLSDEEAFSEIYKRFSTILHRHAYSKLQDREAVRDIIQDLFSSLWDNRLNLLITTNLSAYLYRAVRNRVLNVIAHNKVENSYLNSLSEFVDKDDVIADHQVRERELRALIEEGIATLPRKMQEIFKLSRQQHLSHKEIAERLDLSQHTVNNQIKKALKLMRSKFSSLFLIIITFL